ncbi:CLUMA_CG014272, isoform A [Clunio marinus]|uniref:CLUMA_CG014272, isoform A n=1 Tax=Clunio marinus TaxID=568069 RepID=A0A1J1IL05_9DIPT|nr:CLUMA_CG014272, isoform A [Clunio marinus]
MNKKPQITTNFILLLIFFFFFRRYRWIKNGKHFDFTAYDDRITQQPGRGTLTITKPRDEDLGQYQCFAENEHGIATSNSVFVRKSELNNFKDEAIHTLEAQEGSPFQLKCQPPDGWPKPSVYWMIQTTSGGIKTINNSRMTLDPEGNLWFSNVTRFDASDDSYYACSAASTFRNEYKLGNRVLLKVIPASNAAQNRYQPTRQYVSRRNEVALRGQKIEIFCIYGGTPLPQTIWTKDGRPIAWSDRITQGNYGKSLIIRHTALEDRGSYTCDVSNGAGQPQSSSINLEIKAIPYFTKEPEPQNAAEEETVVFECEAKGIPEPAIKWIHNGKPIEQAPQNPRRTVLKNKIIIKNLLKSDTGNYGCNATNALGYVYKDVYVNVLALPPEIEEAPGKEATVDERDVKLTCRVFGAPKPRIKWIRNGQELTGGRYKIQETGDLIIEKTQHNDAGDYICHAENKFGTKEANGTLVVYQHTQISEAPQDFEVVAGTLATFRCNAESDPGLEREIEWLWNGEVIDLENQARFTMSSDYSLSISNSIELDSGSYTCVARTELDEASASATLTVQDVPNPPVLTGIRCNARDATVSWEPKGDNRSPILYFIIQYNTSFTPDTWADAASQVPATDFSYTVPMSPWANYTYRVIAVNKVGISSPSDHSDSCTTQPDVPYKNPDNVEGKGTEPNNLVIKWSPMAEIDHNAPQFHYRVSWKRDVAGAEWNKEDNFEWENGELLVPNQPTFQRYKIRVQAVNEKGESNVAVKEVEGYSGEDRPTEAPKMLTLDTVVSGTSAMLSWEEVPPESIKGHFRGYKIQTWVEGDEENVKEILMKSNTSKALVNKFTPDSMNYARIMAFNDRFSGPPSNTINFKTPEGVPSTVQSLQAFPMGTSAFMLQWKRPLLTNGILQGYRIYYEEVKGTELGPRQEREPRILDPEVKQAKLAGLKSDQKYRIHIVGFTKQGEGEDYYIEQTTQASAGDKPDKASFEIQKVPSDGAYDKVKINWRPNFAGKPGSHFYVKYREVGQPKYESMDPVISEDFTEVGGLSGNADYEFRVVSVDGKEETESEAKLFSTSDSGVKVVPQGDDTAIAGWFIGMILALAFLILILVIICIIKRNRGGKYDVHDRELANGRQDYPDEGGFHEYSQPPTDAPSNPPLDSGVKNMASLVFGQLHFKKILDNKSQGRQSLNSQKHGPESDTDSMAEYGDGEAGGQFTEDGSFIGQYVPGKLNPPVSPQPIQHQAGSSGAATYV